MNANSTAFLTQGRASRHSLGESRHRERVLEVHQLWGDLVLDSRHFEAGSRQRDAVTIGSVVGWRWSVLGVQLAWLPAGAHVLARFAPPMWSEVQSDWKNDFYAPDDPLPLGREHPLFRWRSGRWEADIDASWTASSEIGGEELDLEALQAAGRATRTDDGWRVPMTDDIALTIQVGDLSFLAHRVRAGQRVLGAPERDWPFLGVTTLVAFLGIMFGVVMWSLPGPARNDVAVIPDRVAALALQMPHKEEPRKVVERGNADAAEGKSAPGEKGKVGKSDAKQKNAKGKPGALARRQHDMDVVNAAGVLGFLADVGPTGGAFSGGLDRNLTDAIGGLHGRRGTQIGTGGFHDRGPGFGNNGETEGTGIGLRGPGMGGSGGCDDDEPCGPGFEGNAKSYGAIGGVQGEPLIIGSLDRALIDEVVKAHLSQIRYCYQRELQRSPALGGKVVIRFIIAKDGTVSRADTKSSTLGNHSVETCIEGRFMRMHFPEPKGQGIVIVTYPFMFGTGS